MAADEAERSGATVVRAYSPKATPRRVLGAVDGANIVIYFGHGTGFPNPYSESLKPAVVDGWACRGRTHAALTRTTSPGAGSRTTARGGWRPTPAPRRGS